jgi:hypothetical protein
MLIVRTLLVRTHVYISLQPINSKNYSYIQCTQILASKIKQHNNSSQKAPSVHVSVRYLGLNMLFIDQISVTILYQCARTHRTPFPVSNQQQSSNTISSYLPLWCTSDKSVVIERDYLIWRMRTRP